MPEAKMATSAPNMSKNKGRAYQDRDKPAQIRFSNISAAKGRHEDGIFSGHRVSVPKMSLFHFVLLHVSELAWVPLFIVKIVYGLNSFIKVPILQLHIVVKYTRLLGQFRYFTLSRLLFCTDEGS